MKTRINQKDYHFDIESDETAVHLIRNQACLTGTKLACGSGVCGACTILLNDEPVVSCLLPAQALADQTVQTIETHHQKNLHPIQYAFATHDALQCGFCTPGFIIEAIAFYTTWRKKHALKPYPTPSKKEVAAALAGHLCRCGAYPNIYKAVQSACAGQFDHVTSCTPPRVEAVAKITGEAKYTVDIQYEGQLVGKILRAPQAKGLIRTIDLSHAKALPGVKAILQLLQPGDPVNYAGKEIVAVAATSEKIAQHALRLIEISYDWKSPVIGIPNATAPNAPTTLHPNSQPENAAEGPVLPMVVNGNVRRLRFNLAPVKGTKAKKLLASGSTKNITNGRWTTQAQIHTPFEPHACVAWWHGESLTVHLSTQSCYASAKRIAKKFGLKANQIQLLAPYVGGAFGAKLAVTAEAIIAIQLAKEAHAPVSLILDRIEEMQVGGYRPSSEIELSLLTNDAGSLVAFSAQGFTDAGAAGGSLLTYNMRQSYAGTPRYLIDYDVLTNMPPGKPFRAPGGPLACWALEQAVDMTAARLQKNPLALRQLWEKDPLRQKLYTAVAQSPLWLKREQLGIQNGRFRRGIGLATGSWSYFYDKHSSIQINTSPNGIVVSTATQDMGNGSRSVLAHAVAEAFGISPNKITVQIGDSTAVYGPTSGGSRTTNALYYPAYSAAYICCEHLRDMAAAEWGLVNPKLIPGGVAHQDGFLDWETILAKVPPEEIHTRRGTDAKIDLLSLIPLGADNLTMGKGTGHAAYVIEIEVDTLLGKTTVLNVWGAIAAGKIHLPQLAESQCFGGIIQGIGYALYEEQTIDPQTGQTLSLGLEEYHLPGIGDTPEIELSFIEEGFEHVKGKGIGLSELATIPIAAAIGNAIFHATDWRSYQLPIRPDRILKGLEGMEQS